MTYECIHHWKLPPPNGTECEGQCSKCGEVKTFYNWDETIQGSPWKRQQKNTWEARKVTL